MGERRRRSRGDRAVRRGELLDAATTAIRRDGAGASMDDIAAEAGITKPILYSHFGDKAGLADALADRFATELAELFRVVWARHDDPHVRLERSIDAWVGFIEADPEIYRFLSQGSFGAGHRLEERRLVAALGAELSRALGAWMRSRGADSGAAEPWAYGLLGMVHVATEWWLERRTMSRSELVGYLTALVWSGFEAHTAGDATADRPPRSTPGSGPGSGPGSVPATAAVRRRAPRRPPAADRPDR
jgi:AcrR family transcriptional regulator